MRLVTKKTTVKFDRDKYLSDFEKKAKKILDKVGNKLIDYMQNNLSELEGYPTAWRVEMMDKLQNKVLEQMDGFILRGIGLVDMPEESFPLIRAKILEHGTGSRGEDNDGLAVAHWKGEPGLNKNVTGYNVSMKPDFIMPDEFNMSPGHWFSDAVKLIEEMFADEADSFIEKMNPLKYIKIV